MTPADSVRRLEMQNFGFTTVFVPVLMSLAAESCRSRAVISLNCSICLMPIFGVGKVCRIWTLKGGPPQLR